MNLEIITNQPQTLKHPVPILFVHGMWHAAWCWKQNFMPYFADHGYKVYALSLRGHGSSDERNKLRWTSLADYVADLVQVIDQIGQLPILVGHSMGGMVVQKYIEKNKVPGVILLASAPPKGVIPATIRIFFRHPLAFLKVNLTLSMFPIIGTPALAREAFFSSVMPEETMKNYFPQLQDESYRVYLDILGFNLPHPKPFQVPMLVLGASDDKIFKPKEVEATAKAYGAQAEIFPDMAHDMMLELNWQKVAEKMLGWLEQSGL